MSKNVKSCHIYSKYLKGHFGSMKNMELCLYFPGIPDEGEIPGESCLTRLNHFHQNDTDKLFFWFLTKAPPVFASNDQLCRTDSHNLLPLLGPGLVCICNSLISFLFGLDNFSKNVTHFATVKYHNKVLTDEKYANQTIWPANNLVSCWNTVEIWIQV